MQEIKQRLDQYLAGQKKLDLTRSQISKLIEAGNILVNDRIVKPSYHLKTTDQLTIDIPPLKKLDAKPENIPLDIVYEDDDLIVVNKPRGMVVHPAVGNYEGTLVNALLHHVKNLSGIGGVARPGIVHRLDKDTSGLIVVAKNDLAHQALAKQFKDREIAKQYVALVKGVIKQDSGEIAAAIGRHPVKRKKMAAGRGREALTFYRVIERFKDATLVELTPKTGRTHQLRVHLNHLGHPIVGDPVYGGDKGTGQLLHAQKLAFTHPRTGEKLAFTAPLPDDLAEAIKKLRKK
jgi:23S rRNA pseudouridine1911/1915/1917 synthase